MKFFQKLLSPNKTVTPTILKENILTLGTAAFSTFITPSQTLTVKDFKELEDYSDNLNTYLKEQTRKNVRTITIVKPDGTIETQDTTPERMKTKEISDFIKLFLANDPQLINKDLLKKQSKYEEQMADIFLNLLTSNNVSITELKKELGENFTKFLELDKRIFNKYLQELSKKNVITQTQTYSEPGMLEKIIERFSSDEQPNSTFTENNYKLPETRHFMLALMNAVEKALNDPPLSVVTKNNLNKIFKKHLNTISKKNFSPFIDKIKTDDKIFELLDLENLIKLKKLMETFKLNESTSYTEIYRKIQEKAVSLELNQDSTVAITVNPKQPTHSSDKQKSEATSEQDDNLKKLISKIFPSPEYSLVEETEKSKGYHIKDKTGKQVFSVEQTPTGSIIKIPQNDTENLVKILEGLTKDDKTTGISVGGLTEEDIASITKILNKKISENKTEYKQKLQKLINKLGNENGNQQLLKALDKIQKQHYPENRINVGTSTKKRLEKVKQGPFHPAPAATQQEKLNKELNSPLHTRPQSARERKRPPWN